MTNSLISEESVVKKLSVETMADMSTVVGPTLLKDKAKTSGNGVAIKVSSAKVYVPLKSVEVVTMVVGGSAEKSQEFPEIENHELALCRRCCSPSGNCLPGD